MTELSMVESWAMFFALIVVALLLLVCDNMKRKGGKNE